VTMQFIGSIAKGQLPYGLKVGVKSSASVFATILEWASLSIGEMYLMLSYLVFAIKEKNQENYMGIYILYQLGVYMNRMIRLLGQF